MANSQCFQSISTQHRVKLPMQNVSTADDYSNEQSAKWLRCEYCSAAVRRCLVLPGIVRDREAHMGDTTHFQQQLIDFFRPTSTKYYMRVSRLHIVNHILDGKFLSEMFAAHLRNLRCSYTLQFTCTKWRRNVAELSYISIIILPWLLFSPKPCKSFTVSYLNNKRTTQSLKQNISGLKKTMV